ncbi:LysM peptidoglycan-binding domain-containing protein [Flavobacteriales bacterium]|jgi:LysM repeat protein|nr:LysM peptidoglycan-binding domain-containing protein [Flavobacteriales bacterium]
MSSKAHFLPLLICINVIAHVLIPSTKCSAQSLAEQWSLRVQQRSELPDFRAFERANPDWKVQESKPALKAAVPALDPLETALLPWGGNKEAIDQTMQVLFEDNYHRAQIIGVLHGRYGGFITSELLAASLPSSFQWVAGLTSVFNAAHEENDHAGIWGLNSAMGQTYGLLQANGIDQRKLVVESTRAFVRELERLQRRFPDDPHRVLVAYWKGMAYATRWTGAPGYDKSLDEQLVLLKVLSRFMVNIERPSFDLDWVEQAQTWQPLACEGEGINRSQLIADGVIDSQTLSALLPWWTSDFLSCADAQKYGTSIPRLVAEQVDANPEPAKTATSNGKTENAEPNDPTVAVIEESATIEGVRCILHTVKKGDTLWNIAQRYPGTTPEDLAEINEISDYIRIGQTLCVPDTK